MRSCKNFKLSPNFSFYEMIEGKALPKKAIAMNWKYIDYCEIEKQREICVRVEEVRDVINNEFKSRNNNKTISLQVNAGWRCRLWELTQGRSGNSQHTIAAMDVVPTNVTKALSDEIILWLFSKYGPRTGGWSGGFAIKRPSANSTGFAHFDNRPEVARWEY